jgi:purine nucleoside phosphorylase
MAVLAAMRMEARTARPLARAGCRIMLSGIGVVRARRAALAALDAGAKRLLVWGTAGGLVAGLAPGTLLLPAEVLDEAGEHFAIAEDWRAQLLDCVPTGIPLAESPLVTAARPLADSQAKSALAAASGALAVDMETAAIARVAAERAVSFAVVRAIADPLELVLPPVVLAAVSERFLAPEVALRLLARPRDARAVNALARVARRACASLAAFANLLADAQKRGDKLY